MKGIGRSAQKLHLSRYRCCWPADRVFACGFNRENATAAYGNSAVTTCSAVGLKSQKCGIFGVSAAQSRLLACVRLVRLRERKRHRTARPALSRFYRSLSAQLSVEAAFHNTNTSSSFPPLSDFLLLHLNSRTHPHRSARTTLLFRHPNDSSIRSQTKRTASPSLS